MSKEKLLTSILVTTYDTKARMRSIKVIPIRSISDNSGIYARFTFTFGFSPNKAFDEHYVSYTTDSINMISDQDSLRKENEFIRQMYAILQYKKKKYYAGFCDRCYSPMVSTEINPTKDNVCDNCLGSEIAKYKDINVVYLMESRKSGLWKIGTSSNVKKRRRKLELSQGSLIDILKVLPGSYGLEKMIQDKFSEFNVLGEWFEPRDEILDFFNSMDRGLT
jgi:hypothetical protein